MVGQLKEEGRRLAQAPPGAWVGFGRCSFPKQKALGDLFSFPLVKTLGGFKYTKVKESTEQLQAGLTVKSAP